jgi:hypothetical protein
MLGSLPALLEVPMPSFSSDHRRSAPVGGTTPPVARRVARNMSGVPHNLSLMDNKIGVADADEAGSRASQAQVVISSGTQLRDGEV